MEEIPPYSGAGGRRRSHHSPRGPPCRREGNRRSSSRRSQGKWWNDPEAKRMRRLAKYKLYTAEGKVKTSFKQGLRWLKIKCVAIVTTP